MKIAIGLSVGENVKTKTLATIVSIIKRNSDIDLIIKQSCLVHKNRNDIVEEALKGYYTHLFFIDSDMCFAPEVLDRLLEREFSIVGANYFKRNNKKESVVRLLLSDDISGLHKELFECESIGTGCVLINMDVFKNIENHTLHLMMKFKEKLVKMFIFV